MAVVHDMLVEPNAPLPRLTRVVEVPVFASDGQLVVTPGYQPASGIYYDPAPGFVVPDIPEHPSHRDLRRVIRLLLDELLVDFPFATEADRAHAVALLLLPFARSLIAGPTPLHLIEKPTPGTGGTLLAQIVASPVLGRPAPTMIEGSDAAEWSKRITAKLLEGPAVILIDNVRHRLESAALAMALTATVYEDRVLGESKIVRVPVHAAWIATGNNPVLSDEIARRTVRIRLDAEMEHPWERTDFRHPDLRTWATEHRADLVGACCVLVRAWLAAGRPPGSETIGMFEGWAAVMGGILNHADIRGFLSNRETFFEEEVSESAAWRFFLQRWWHTFDRRSVSVHELYTIVRNEGIPLELSGRDEHAQRTSFGMRLRQQRGRQYGNLRIHWVTERRGAQYWRLTRVQK
jgi:hypothetical protein